MKFGFSFILLFYTDKNLNKSQKIEYIFFESYLNSYSFVYIIPFARSRMKRNFHVRFCNRDGIEKEPSTITPKELDSVNNIEEE